MYIFANGCKNVFIFLCKSLIFNDYKFLYGELQNKSSSGT